MEGESVMGENGESSNNVIVGEHEEDENESRSVENIDGYASGDKQDSPHVKSSKRRKYSKHKANQVQELEAFFNKNPHPTKKERLELGKKLSMDNKKVKFWFQNKRVHYKMRLEHHENVTMKEENRKLRLEQLTMKAAMRNPICIRCGNQAYIIDFSADERQTKFENDQLKDEVKRIRVLEDKLLGPSASLKRSMASININFDLGFVVGENGFGGINIMDTTSPMGPNVENGLSKLMDLASAAMNELLRLAEIGEPLWVRSLDGGGETMNLEEYAKSFTQFTRMKPGHYITEATRASGTVINNSLTVVETLMDKRRWMELFSCIVGKTSTIDVISNGIGGGRNGTLQLIQTEFQIISDLVPVREIKFLRFCQQHGEGIWAVVDVSIDTIPGGSQQCEIGNCRRLPSGCIIQDVAAGYSKVTWIEHMEYNEKFVHHLYHPLVKIGLGFGAQRWMTTLQRQSELLSLIKFSVASTVCSSAQISIWMLAQRMNRNFCAGICATNYKWKTIQLANEEDAKLMLRKNIDDPSEPIGVVLSATKTIWLPVKPQCLFEFFINEQTRSQWDVFSSSGSMQQMVHISKGQNLDSSISLFRANGDDTSVNQKDVLILQDAFMDSTGSVLVYATIDSLAKDVVMNGEDSSRVALLPSGIAIVPDYFQDFSEASKCIKIFGTKVNGFKCSTGSLVTIGFQVLVSSSPAADLSMESVKTVNDRISRTIHGIKSAFKCK